MIKRFTHSLLLLLIGLFCVQFSHAQNITGVVNTYAKVTSISGSTFTLGTPAGRPGAGIQDFNAGQKVLVYQAKGASINETSGSSFGQVTSLGNAGKYEIARVVSRSGFDVSLSSLVNTYDVAGLVQLIYIPSYGNISVTGTLSSTAWNKTNGYGGLVVIDADRLTLSGNISVDGQGFEGGARSSNNGNGCVTVYRETNTIYGEKGEGISTHSTYTRGQGPLANGGGGGSTHNGGGGGGSNHGQGAQGGIGWSCSASTNAGGFGGEGMSYTSSSQRLFLGGGGGGGQQNNSIGTKGGDGGGIVILLIEELTTDCVGTRTISARGQNSSSAGNDGAGGAGAGGVIYIYTQTYNPNGCNINLNVDGGDGGDVNNGGTHGGGGGGGSGLVYSSVSFPTGINLSGSNGTDGDDNTGGGQSGIAGVDEPVDIVFEPEAPIGLDPINGPGDVTNNLRLWLKADAGTGTIGTSWEDQSGNANDYTTVTGPTLVNDALNFNPTVEILSGGFNAPLGTELGTAWTVFFVSQKLVSDPDGRLFDGHTGNYLWGYHDIHRSGLYLNANPNEYNSGIATTEGNEDLHIMVFNRESGGTLDARTDGELLKTFGTSNSANGIRVDINQGNYSSQSSDSRVGEMILYSTSLSDFEMNKVESYLGIKYGLTLDHDYLASDGTVIWDYSANTTYHNDVTGIGRDDNSGLDQQKSKSSNNTGAVTIDKRGAFASDGDFLLWGNNGAANGTSTDVDLASYDSRLNKTWKVASSGTPGAVDFSIDLEGLGLPTALNASDYTLLIDGNGVFATGATTHTTGAVINNGVLSFTGVSFSDGDYFTIAATNLTGPGDVTANLRLWLKADEGVSEIGGTITQWDDYSGHMLNATQGTAASQPVVSSDQLNYNPMIRFDGGNDFLNSDFMPSIVNKDVSFIAVASRRSTKSNNYYLRQTGVNTTGQNLHYGFRTNVVQTEAFYAADINVTIPGYTGFGSENAGISLSTHSSTNGKYTSWNQNSTLYESVSSDITNLTNVGMGHIGGVGTGGYNGDLAELIIYNQELSSDDQVKIKSYLAIKYGITLDNTGGGIAGDYRASDGTLLWDASVSSAYHNNVTGIGRDDGSELDQQKSTSSSDGGVVIIDKGGTFGTDGDFILWGNNGVANGTSTDVDLTNFDVRLNKVWKVAVTGTPGTVDFSIDLASLGIPTALDAADYSLLIDGDGIFATGATAHTTGAAINSGVLSFTGVSFSDGDYFTLVTKKKVTPGGISASLEFWLKADAGTGSTSDGGTVNPWEDQLDVNNAIKSGTIALPTYQTNQLNFNPVMDYSAAANQVYNIPNSGDINTINNTIEKSFSIVFTTGTDVASRQVLYEEGGQARGVNAYIFNNELYIGAWNRVSSDGSGDDWGFESEKISIVANTTYLLTFNMLGNNSRSGKLELISEGKLELTNNNIGRLYSHGGQIGLGGMLNDSYFEPSANGESGNNYYFKGELAEITYAKEYLDAAKRNRLESYLAIKYGITLDQSSAQNYTASDGTVVWSGSTNSSYNNDIAGIAKDDDTELDQLKSKSVNTSSVVTIANGTSISSPDVFSVDNSFLIWGHNGSSSTALTGDYLGKTDFGVARVWRVAESGTVGNVRLAISNTDLPASVTSILVSSDPTFPNTVATRTVSLSAGAIREATVDFANGEYFTFSKSNTAPVLSNMESTVINYCDGNEPLTSNLTVTDTDGDTQTAIITFDSGFQSGEDVLVYTIGTGVTVISQTAQRIEIQAGVANMQTALRAISYTNSQSGSSRTTANRIISIILNDGTDDSNKVTRTIKPSRVPHPVGIFY